MCLVPIHLRPYMIMIPAACSRQLVGTAVLGVTLLTFVSGCASHGPSWSARFVKPGEPTATFDDRASATPPPPRAPEVLRAPAADASGECTDDDQPGQHDRVPRSGARERAPETEDPP